MPATVRGAGVPLRCYPAIRKLTAASRADNATKSQFQREEKHPADGGEQPESQAGAMMHKGAG